MSEVRVGTKLYKDLESLSISKLEHIVQLQNDNIVNYKAMVPHPSPQRAPYINAHIKRMQANVDLVMALIKQKREEVPFPKE